MLYKYGKHIHEFLGPFFFYFGLVLFLRRGGGIFNKTIIPVTLVGYEMITTKLGTSTSLAIYHLISNTCSSHKSVLETILLLNNQ